MGNASSDGDYQNRRNIAIWLLACAAMVATMVVIGGITRLTESGLSMTEWRPLIGWIPPLSEVEWQRIFDRYRQTSEYRIQFPGMDLDGFKTIFWWEYIHRVWGRLIGLVYALPMAWFVVRGRVERPLIPHLWALLFLGAVQGLVGWWMVKSGFVDRDDVSQYRLTTHLGVAIVILGYLLWLAIGQLQRAEVRVAAPVTLRRLALAVLAVVFITVLSGGMVAGINAGFIHNTWPLMDGGLLPEDFAALTPFWMNFFENHSTVQFDHRMLAYLTAALVVVYWFRARGAALHARGRLAANLLGAMLLLQILLGVVTLLLVVPISVAIPHQFGAEVLFALAIWNAWELSLPKNSTT